MVLKGTWFQISFLQMGLSGVCRKSLLTMSEDDTNIFGVLNNKERQVTCAG